MTNKVVIDRDVMDACPQLELICVVATGMNNVDLEYAAKKGIAVKNVAGYSTESVTQCTFAMLFYLFNSSAYYDEYVKSGQYAASPVFTHLGREYRELNGKLWGIIGMGTIGRRVAEVAQATVVPTTAPSVAATASTTFVSSGSAALALRGGGV